MHTRNVLSLFMKFGGPPPPPKKKKKKKGEGVSDPAINNVNYKVTFFKKIRKFVTLDSR